MTNDTIAAICTPLAAAAIGIIRISGSQAGELLLSLFRTEQAERAEQLEDRHLYLGRVYDRHGQALDAALAVLMRGPHSYTGEDCAELQLHGSPRLLRTVLGELIANGARLAEPGEFTQRAFLNGKLDLAQAEAVQDMISAATAPAVHLAANQLIGQLSAEINRLEEGLLEQLALITVGVDFPDDADAPEAEQLLGPLRCLQAQIASLLETAKTGRLYREGLAVAITGAVNVGKSSLLNALLGHQRAIVTDLAGTTRDVLSEQLELDGIPLTLIDTAGLRGQTQADAAEQQGMQRGQQAASQSQLRLVVIDAALGAPLDAISRQLVEESNGRKLLLLNKCDIAQPEQVAQLQAELASYAPGAPVLAISAKSAEGLEQLRQAMLAIALDGAAAPLGNAWVTNLRHQQALVRAGEQLGQAITSLEQGLEPDVAAIDLENALDALGEISGKSPSEEVLTAIFAKFCLGK